MRAAYPRHFRTPEGRPVSIRQMAKALRVIRANPDADFPGWNWFPTPGRLILREFRRGLNDRINLRAAANGALRHIERRAAEAAGKER